VIWSVGAAEETIVVAGHRLRVARHGAGPPLLLINGLGASMEMWDAFVRRLSGREVIALDLPGAGLSPPGRWPMRMASLARLIAGLQQQLGYDQVDVLGYSLGGLLAQEFAHRSPDRVRRLVLAATTPGMLSVPPSPLVTLMMLSPARYYDRRLARLIVPRIAGGVTARDQGVLRTGLEQRLAKPPSLTGYLHQLYAASGWTSHGWLRQLPQPTLVVHGDEDPVVPLVNARYLARTIPEARLHVVPGGGHLMLLDEPARTVPVIEKFLDEAPFPWRVGPVHDALTPAGQRRLAGNS
jgi:poly(3-hydroxyoctanoate) depolymerase